MPLVQCASCGNQISVDATVCPKCGHPRNVSPARKHRSPIRGIVGLVCLIIIASVCYKLFVSQETKDDVNMLASATGLGIQLIPWVDRADTMLRAMLEGPTKDAIASTIQGVAHPSGEKPVMRDFDIRKVGDRISARFSVGWRGGVLGTTYTTVVVWEFDKNQYSKATVVEDDASFAVGSPNAKQLDDYFRTEVYATLRRNLSN